MNLFRFTVIDSSGGISFVAHAEALSALLKACARQPESVDELLEFSVPYYGELREQVLNGLAVFDERNAGGNYDAIHEALQFCQPHELPVFRIVDDETREASLRPVKAGGIILNLTAKRVVQIQNTYRQIGRKGLGYVFDGKQVTESIYYYRLPRDWALVP